MGIEVHVLPQRGLVLVQYAGNINVAETMAAFDAFVEQQDRVAGFKHLVDLSRVTGYDEDWLELMRMQARKADVFGRDGEQTLMVYLAPAQDTLGLAQLVARSWDGLGGVTALVQQDEGRALSLLGVPERTVAELLQRAD